MSLTKLIDYPSVTEKIIHLFLFAYFFLLIFPHTTTPKEIILWTAVLCWIIIRIKRPEPFIRLTPIITALSLFMVIAFIASVSGAEPIENLKRFKGELLVPFLFFLITATEFNSIEKSKRLLYAPLIAFAIYTMLAVFESANYGLHQYFWIKSNREQYIWLDNYTQMSAAIFPLILGLILLTVNRGLRYLLVIYAVSVFGIVTAYRGFTVFSGTVMVLLLWIISVRPLKYRWRMAVLLSLFILAFVSLMFFFKDDPGVQDYRLKFEKVINVSEEFEIESGFSNRLPAWKASIDVIKDRPLLGYGWGIKKFQKLVQKEKFMEKWKVEKPSVYNFYTTYKNVFFPPHNLFLEIAIQSGLLGLSAFIIFIGIYLCYLMKAIRYNSAENGHNFAVIVVGGTILSFIIMSLMSNELGNISGKIFFVVLGVGAAWINSKPRQKAQAELSNGVKD